MGIEVKRLSGSEFKIVMKKEYTNDRCARCNGFKNSIVGGKYLYRHYIVWDKPGIAFKMLKDPHLFCDGRCRESFYK